MADTPFSQVIFNAREEAESDDWNRLQKLSSRELQNLMRGLHRAPSYSDAPFLAGAPISGVLTAPSLMGVAGSYSMTLGAGDGFFELAGASSDSSSYRVLRWAEQAIVFGVPDPVNPRIDLVVATPGTEGTDQQVRTIRVDPNSNPPVDKDAPVPKTLNPKTTISVVAGVAGGSPAAPAVPAGSIALFEVYIPGGAVDTTSFEPVRRAHRLAEHPLASQPCILRGCHVLWDMTVNPANANPGISMRTEDSAAVIDGEVIEWYQPPAFVRDTLADPMALPAIANICKPYYLYLCGGRHLPQLSRSTGRATPVVVVESMTAPEIDRQRPSAPINTPRGQTQDGALFIGVGFVYMGTTNRLPCYHIGDMVYGVTALVTPASTNGPQNINPVRPHYTWKLPMLLDVTLGFRHDADKSAGLAVYDATSYNTALFGGMGVYLATVGQDAVPGATATEYGFFQRLMLPIVGANNGWIVVPSSADVVSWSYRLNGCSMAVRRVA